MIIVTNGVKHSTNEKHIRVNLGAKSDFSLTINNNNLIQSDEATPNWLLILNEANLKNVETF